MRQVYRNIRNFIYHSWRMFWLHRSGRSGCGRLAAWLASRHAAPHHQRSYLAYLLPKGFVDAGASLAHQDLHLGSQVYLGKGVMIYRTGDGGPVELMDRVHLYGNSFIETGMGGRIRIAEDTHVQPGCHIHAFISDVEIGSKVEIAPGCAFYNYDHGMKPDSPIMEQPLTSKGPIRVGDGAWLGHGVTVLQGVSIGDGAIIAAGSVVIRDIPANAVAGGVPAKVIRFRSDSPAPVRSEAVQHARTPSAAL